MKVEVRSDHVLIDGYVNAVGRDSREIPDRRGSFVEQVMPGAFARALGKGEPVELRLNHERALGSTADGTLELAEDSIGLRARAKITDPEVMEKARGKKLRGWSFGFRQPVDEWEEREAAPPRRYLKDFVLTEVTIVDDRKRPAYAATSIETRDGSDDPPEYEIEEAAPPPDIPAADARTAMAGYRARRLKIN